MSESPSRYEDLVNILPKTRYVHIESPSRHVKNEDSAQRGAPGLKVFGHPQLLTRKVVYIFTTRPSHIYTWSNRYSFTRRVHTMPKLTTTNQQHTTRHNAAQQNLIQHTTKRMAQRFRGQWSAKQIQPQNKCSRSIFQHCYTHRSQKGLLNTMCFVLCCVL